MGYIFGVHINQKIVRNCHRIFHTFEIMASAAASSDVEATTTAGTATVITAGATTPKQDEKIEAFPLPAWV